MIGGHRWDLLRVFLLWWTIVLVVVEAGFVVVSKNTRAYCGSGIIGGDSSSSTSSRTHSVILMAEPQQDHSQTTTTDDDPPDSFQLFGRFKIAPSQIFFQSKWSAGIVNLRPIVPGHVLVISKRVVPYLSDLEEDEYLDLWQSVRIIQRMLKRQQEDMDFNVAVQDGRAAGQSVPHVHVHILPRTKGDFERNDDIYDQLEQWAPRPLSTEIKPSLDVPADQNRVDRTMEEMQQEAETYRRLLLASNP
eukprot:scaffold4523_cov50-Attheya_sp.AAC.1